MLFTENAANSSLPGPDDSLVKPAKGPRLLPSRGPVTIPAQAIRNSINHAGGKFWRVQAAAISLCILRRSSVLDNLIGRGQNDASGRGKVGLGSIRRPVIGLALGGGAARGFAHIGIVRTLDCPRHRPRCRGRHLDWRGHRRRLCRGAARQAGGMGPQPAAAKYSRLSRYPPQRFRTDWRRQACRTT